MTPIHKNLVSDRLIVETELKHRKLHGDNIKSLEHNSKKVNRPKELPCKEFVSRNSTLTNLWENSHMCSLYNMSLASLVLLYVKIIIIYLLNFQRFKDDISILLWSFGQFHIVSAVWVAIHVSIVFLLYPAFRFWATTRLFIKKKGIYDAIFGSLFVIYQLGLLIIPPRVIIEHNLPPLSSFIILTEQSRLFMKTYAFVRENITHALQYKPHQDGGKKVGSSKPCPEVEKLIYFIFAPTLVYRDNYPRTSHVRWSYVGWNFLQFLGCIMGGYIPYNFILVTFSRVGIESMPLETFIGILAMSLFAGMCFLLPIFYGMLHCWLNAFAEMMRFGDRLFYDDWWNCTSFAKYYRSLNIVVHDWLYSYIYRDMYILLGRSRTGAMLVVLLISAVVHEYIISVCLKFVFPILFISFYSFGVIFMFLTRGKTSNFWNVFLWGTLFQGWGFFTAFYSLEWYARINCPRTLDSWLDYVVPRTFTCGVISLP